ncbi:hypothetical protein Glove_144g152 [Diversispora epigaea]|uniref:Uncharacterized protein n=1 Tax=Diversispora epigaea TaxID=1348612 RepID=A0A397J3X3_9GLOM|nr:hypothetical protein Glove_144g152 [Diversispora epigaea]
MHVIVSSKSCDQEKKQRYFEEGIRRKGIFAQINYKIKLENQKGGQEEEKMKFDRGETGGLKKEHRELFPKGGLMVTLGKFSLTRPINSAADSVRLIYPLIPHNLYKNFSKLTRWFA